MAELKLPLSGNVSQVISPWTAWFSAFGSQIGLVNVNLGQSSAPEVEREILSEVGSYGKQLGRVGDVLTVLLKHFRPDELLPGTKRKRSRRCGRCSMKLPISKKDTTGRQFVRHGREWIGEQNRAPPTSLVRAGSSPQPACRY